MYKLQVSLYFLLMVVLGFVLGCLKNVVTDQFVQHAAVSPFGDEFAVPRPLIIEDSYSDAYWHESMEDPLLPYDDGRVMAELENQPVKNIRDTGVSVPQIALEGAPLTPAPAPPAPPAPAPALPAPPVPAPAPLAPTPALLVPPAPPVPAPAPLAPAPALSTSAPVPAQALALLPAAVKPGAVVNREMSSQHHVTPHSNNEQDQFSIKRTTGGSKSSYVATGYMLAVNYYEQQTMGSRNLFQLQCLAAHLNFTLVKPVMKDSFLRTPLDDSSQLKFLKFEDSFDLADWNARTERSHHAPLVEWDTFLSTAPRDVILLRINYPSVSDINQRKKLGRPVTHKSLDDQYKKGCGSEWPIASEVAFFKAKRFQIVREVCLNFYYGDEITFADFARHLLGEHSGAKVTVIMDMWRGLGSSQRVLIRDVCTNTYPIQEYIQPSQHVVRLAEAYIQTYMSGRPYVAVMGRLEMSLLTVHTKGLSISSCLKDTAADLMKLRKESGLNETFLSLDIGKYGSKKWRGSKDKELPQLVGHFLSTTVGEQMSLASWESQFEDISGTKDAGFIAMLQKVIVTRAKCILFVGGGAFQRHALHLYRQLNRDKREECLRYVKSCTSPSKFQL